MAKGFKIGILMVFFFFNIINKLSFLEQFYICSKIEWTVQKIPISPLPQHMHSLSHFWHPPPEWYICYNWWTHTDVFITWSPQLTAVITLGGVHSVSLDKCMMTCIYLCSNIQSGFSALKILLLQLFIPPYLS